MKDKNTPPRLPMSPVRAAARFARLIGWFQIVAVPIWVLLLSQQRHITLAEIGAVGASVISAVVLISHGRALERMGTPNKGTARAELNYLTGACVLLLVTVVVLAGSISFLYLALLVMLLYAYVRSDSVPE